MIIVNFSDIVKNNLNIIKNKDKLKKVENANVVLNKNIPLLRSILITLNQKYLGDGKKIILKNHELALQISVNEIIKDQRPTTQKKLNIKKVSNLIKLACLCGAIRKVELKDLNFLMVKKFTHDKLSKNKAIREESIYQILDLRNCRFERIKKFDVNTELKYPAILEKYGKEIADNCFNRPFGTNKKVKRSPDIKKKILRFMDGKKIVKLSDFSNGISQFEDVDFLSNKKSQKKSKQWWYQNVKCEFELGTFDETNFKLCKFSDLKKSIKKELPAHGNSLVIVKI